MLNPKNRLGQMAINGISRSTSTILLSGYDVEIFEIESQPSDVPTVTWPGMARTITHSFETEALISPEALLALFYDIRSQAHRGRRRLRRAKRRSLSRNRIEATRAFYRGEPWGIDPYKGLQKTAPNELSTVAIFREGTEL